MNWDKLREWLQTAGLVAIPVMVTIMGNKVAKSNTTREVNAKMVEVAAQVLNTPVNDSTRDVRAWATKVIALYSEVPLSVRAESSLAGHPLSLPAGWTGYEVPIPAPLCSTGRIGSGDVVVIPGDVNLIPGQQVQFRAYRLTRACDKVPFDARDWSGWIAEGGGRISSTGLFTADTVVGDFIVNAYPTGGRGVAYVHVRTRP